MPLLNQNDLMVNEQCISNIRVSLKDHQRRSLFSCLKLEHEDNVILPEGKKIRSKIGIYSDDVGTGKSAVILALCNQLPPRQHQNILHSTNFFSIYSEDELTNNQHNILIVPHNLISHWKKMIQTFVPDMKHFIIEKTKDINNFIKDEQYRLIICSSTRLNSFYQDAILKHNLIFNRVIYEEADSINLPSNPYIESMFYWLVTATPEKLFFSAKNRGFLSNLINNMKNLSIFGSRYYSPMVSGIIYQDQWFEDDIGSITIKNSYESIRESLGLPKIVIQNIICKTPHNINGLNQYLTNEKVKEALIAGDTTHAIELLNCRVDNNSNLVSAIVSNLKKSIFRIKHRINYRNDIQEQDFRELSQLELDRQVADTKELETLQFKLDSITERLQSNCNCPICLSKPSIKATLDCCQQWFCFECITECLVHSNKCPMCRSPKCVSDIIVQYSDEQLNNIKCGRNAIGDERDDQLLSKDKQLIKLLSNSDKQTLIFSDYDGSFFSIKHTLDSHNIKYKELKGSSSSISKIINDYEKKKIFIILLNSKYQGAGHNLQSSDRIIMYHKLNKFQEKQVIGRANRIGRNKTLEVFRLVYQCEETELHNDKDDEDN